MATSFENWAKNTPSVLALIKKDPKTPAEIDALVKLKISYSNGYSEISKQLILISQIAVYKVKKDAGIISAADEATYATLRSKLNESKNKVAKSASNTIEMAAIAEELKQQKLAAVRGGTQGTIEFKDPSNYYEYMLRTQSLNPYGRERQCDRDFLALLLTIATQVRKEKNFIENCTTYLKAFLKS